MSQQRSGNGFVQCSDGHVRWGIFGAAGVVFVTSGDAGDAEPRVMLQLRSGRAHEGGTWSCAGGALDEGEDPLDGALREAAEEIGPLPQGCELLGAYVFEAADDWSYTTAVVATETTFGTSVNFETDAVEWVAIGAVDRRPLHQGFAAAWPHLRAIVESVFGV